MAVRSVGAVVVTGASTGIGAATALRLDASGFEVLAGVRRDIDGEELRARGSSRLTPVILDVTDEATITKAVDTLGDRPLVGLVNNAGIAVGGPLEYVSLADVRQVMEVNVIGVLAVTQAFLPALRVGQGRIVTVGSVGGRVASPFVGPYNASKFAIEALTDALRQELRPWGLQVIVVEPGAVSTPIWGKGAQAAQEITAQMPAEARARYGKALVALNELMAKLDKQGLEPEKVARVIHRALTTRRPSTRYLVGPEARAQLAFKTLLPDRVMDRATAKLMGL